MTCVLRRRQPQGMIMIPLAVSWLIKKWTHKNEMLAAYLLLTMIYCCIGLTQ